MACNTGASDTKTPKNIESVFDVLSQHPEIVCLNDTFSVFVDVFGVYIVATPEAPLDQVIHSANVLAQYIDNDADGMPDDQAILEYLVRNNYVIPVWSSGRFSDDSDIEKFFKKIRGGFSDDSDRENSDSEKYFENIRGTDCEENVGMAASMYYDEDKWALGGIQSAGTWDTNLEEIWHVVSVAWYDSYPDYFGDSESVSSMLTDAMDVARGGRFLSTPERYPENAWYTYDDEGCNYGCMVHEYFYWILMANLDALDPALTDKCRGSEDEWSVCNRDQLAQIDPLAHSLLNDYDFKLPAIIPDGAYVPSATYTNSVDEDDEDED